MGLADRSRRRSAAGGQPVVASQPWVDAWTYQAGPIFLKFFIIIVFLGKFGKWARAFERMEYNTPIF
jgi:hypothetical protein